MTSAILFMAIVPLALVLVFVFSLLEGRMSEGLRKRVGLGLTLLLYPALILTFAWQAWDNQQAGDPFGCGVMLVLVCLFTIQFVLAVRTGTLFPRFRTPKA